MTIYTADTNIQDFHMDQADTLTLIFMVDPNTVSFYYSTIYRFPEGLFDSGTLTRFSAYDAGISSLTADDFDNADSLQSLYLSDNPITQLPNYLFAEAPLLTTIDLTFCDISEIAPYAFSGLQYLRYVYLYGNEIVQLTDTVFSQLPNLYLVDLGGNELINAEFANFSGSQMTSLWLDSNKISYINPGDIISSTLYNLYLHNNDLTTLQDYVFRDVPYLSSLNLGTNEISEIEDFAFYGLYRLTQLMLYMNDLEEINPRAFLSLSTLYNLDLGYNEISDISFRLFSALQNVGSMWLNNNNLEELDMGKLVAMKSLYSLYLYENDLDSIDLTDIGFVLQSLRYISLNNNDFTCQEVARIHSNLRQFNIYPASVYYDPIDEDQVILDGISCYDPLSIRRNKDKSMSQEQREEVMKAKTSDISRPANAREYIEQQKLTVDFAASRYTISTK